MGAIIIIQTNLMFEAKFEDGHIFKVIIDSLAAVVEKDNFEITPEGIQVRAMDASHVALAQLSLSCEGFDSYTCDKTQVIGIDMRALSKYLKFVEGGSSLTLTAEDDASHLDLKQDTPKGVVDMQFQLLNIEEESMEIPQQDYAARIVLGAGRFSKLIKDMRQIDDTIQIKAAKDKALLAVHGQFGKIDMQLAHNEDEVANPDAKTKIETAKNTLVDQQFALGYLDLFARASQLSTFVTLGLVPEQPVMVEFPVTGFGELRYFLAPKLP